MEAVVNREMARNGCADTIESKDFHQAPESNCLQLCRLEAEQENSEHFHCDQHEPIGKTREAGKEYHMKEVGQECDMDTLKGARKLIEKTEEVGHEDDVNIQENKQEHKKSELIATCKQKAGNKLSRYLRKESKVNDKHTRAPKTRRIHQCEYCAKVFERRWPLIYHIRTHTGEKPYICPLCGKGFSLKNQLTKHNLCAHSEEAFQCDRCEKHFVKKHQLIIHTRIHTGEKPFKCDICDGTFASESAVIHHKKALHTQTVASHNCPLCDKSFRLKCYLRRHIKRHKVVEEQHLCSICGKTFQNQYSLKLHSKWHETNQPCRICGKTFSAQASLDRHMFSHEGKVPCPVCGKRFLFSESALAKHLKAHRDGTATCEVPTFKCRTCPKSFDHECNLRIHMRVHSGERPYKCEICGKGFKQSSHLVTHKYSHSGEKPFQCTECESSFVAKFTLNKHIRKHHKQPKN